MNNNIFYTKIKFDKDYFKANIICCGLFLIKAIMMLNNDSSM